MKISIRRAAILAIFVAIFASSILARPANAIINGTSDGNRHPNVGLISVAGNPWCSGVLISPLYFATAGHCIQQPLSQGRAASDFAVTFASVATATSPTYRVAAVSYDPKFLESYAAGNQSVNTPTNDCGLIKFQQPVNGITPANLPPLGYDKSIPTGQPILQPVGYGTYAWQGNSNIIYPVERRFANVSLTTGNAGVTDKFLKVNGTNTGQCYGDSGGPTFVGNDTTLVVALMSFSTSAKCSGWAYESRMDTTDARNFYAAYD